jgi:hypothetical protein
MRATGQLGFERAPFLRFTAARLGHDPGGLLSGGGEDLVMPGGAFMLGVLASSAGLLAQGFRFGAQAHLLLVVRHLALPFPVECRANRFEQYPPERRCQQQEINGLEKEIRNSG